MESAEEIINTARAERRLVLTEVESKQIINTEGIKVVETRLARTKNEALAIASEIGFPVVVKTAAPGIIHKSDYGGVKLYIKSLAEVGRAYSAVANIGRQPGTRETKRKKSRASVQKMAPDGVEVIMGISKDPQFGHVIMFGLGGVFVETLGDISFRIVPIEHKDAKEMIQEINGYEILQGYRGSEAIDICALEEMLLKLSELSQKMPEIKEIDLNPVLAWPDGAMAVDARIVLDKLAFN